MALNVEIQRSPNGELIEKFNAGISNTIIGRRVGTFLLMNKLRSLIL